MRKVVLSSAQQAEIDKHVRQVKAGTADRFRFTPPEPTMRSVFTTVAFTLLSVIVGLPHKLWQHLGIPSQPPCPVHGFDSGVKDHTARKWRGRAASCACS